MDLSDAALAARLEDVASPSAPRSGDVPEQVRAAGSRALQALGGELAPDKVRVGSWLGPATRTALSRLAVRWPWLRKVRNALEALLARLPVGRGRLHRELRARERALAELVDLVGALHPEAPLGAPVPAGAPGDLRVAWVSSWNTRCGLATYSRYLLETWQDAPVDVVVQASRTGARTGLDGTRVRRTWDDFSRPQLEELDAALRAERPEVVVVQFHFGYFAVEPFGRWLRELAARRVPVLVVLHATEPVAADNLVTSLDAITPDLAGASRLLVHSRRDVDRLARLGLVENVVHFPHGAADRPRRDLAQRRAELGLEGGPWVGTFGFLGPQKGVPQLVEAAAQLAEELPQLRLLLLHADQPFPESRAAAAAVREAVAAAGLADRVTFLDDFFSEAAVHRALQAMDLVVFPYQGSGEGASGAVRFGLTSGRPVACTPLGVFEELEEVVHRLPGTDPSSLAAGLRELLTDPERRRAKEEAQRRWVEAHAWPRVGAQLLELCREVAGRS